MKTRQRPVPLPPVELASIPSVPCPCGVSRRAFAAVDGPCSVHLVQVSRDSRTHYHRLLTEVYYVLSGEGILELDGERHPLRPGFAVMIRPGTRHRAVPGEGGLTLLNLVVPRFDPADEWFDDAPS